jgi:DNA polymerase I-like protein with 3'-5' exonuclease and polymerase domains
MEYNICIGRNGRLLDLMLFSQVLNAGDKINHGLGDLYARFLEPAWFKIQTGKTFIEYKAHKSAMQSFDWETHHLPPDQLQYACDDVLYVFYVLEALFEDIDEWVQRFPQSAGKDRGLAAVISLECSLIPVFALMELRGVTFDISYQQTHVIRYLEEKRDEAALMLGFTRTVKVKRSNGLRGIRRVTWEEEIVEPMNLRSWQQLRPRINEMLAEHLGEGIEIESTSEDDIRDIVNRYAEFDEDEPLRPVLPKEIKEQLLWILQFKKASSLLSKYGEKMIKLAHDTGKIHPSWYQIGTDELAIDSGRSSCRNPNMMNIPSRGWLFATRFNEKGKPIDGINVMQFFRRAFIADPGWIFIDTDYSQQEPRLAAEYCNERELINQYLTHGKKTDIHGIVAKKLMRLPEQPAKGDFNRDYIGKTAGLSLIYGISARSLKDFMYSKTEGKVKWNEKQAKDAYDAFFAGFPKIREKMDEVSSEMRRRASEAGHSLRSFKKNRRPFAVAYTVLGRHRKFCLKADQMRMADHELDRSYMPPLLDKKTKKPVLDEKGNVVLSKWNVYKERLSAACREGFNHAIQGTAADILKTAILDMHYRFLAAGFDWEEGIIAVIHDEVLVHVKKEHEEQAKAIVEDAMIKAGQKFMRYVPSEVDTHTGYSWSEAKQD